MLFAKKIKTHSSFTYILEKNNKKIVKKIKRDNKDLHGYPRVTPIEVIYNLINNSELYCPKLIQNKRKYFLTEYIDGEEVNSILNKSLFMTSMINNFSIMKNLESCEVKKYITWSNNSEFLKFLVNHMLNIYNSFDDNTKSKLSKLNIDSDNLLLLNNCVLDNERNMTFIHGDLHYGNMKYKNNQIYIFDWELATYADIAYELATHFILVDYTLEEHNFIIIEISKLFKCDIIKLKNDIKIYTIFELYRRIYMKITKIKNIITKSDLNELYNYYKNLNILLERESYSFNDFGVIVLKNSNR